MTDKNKETYCPANREDWREWLQNNHETSRSVWLICYRVSSGIPTITWSDAVDEALCFGWIDSTRKPIDDKRFMQLFTKRKPKSTWSRINKEKIQKLIEENRMTKAGHETIDRARQNGSWTILDDVEKLIIPEDLEFEFQKKPGTMAFFLSLSKSVRKAILQWVILAKRAETRQKRIREIVENADQNQKPKHLR